MNRYSSIKKPFNLVNPYGYNISFKNNGFTRNMYTKMYNRIYGD